MDSNYTCFVYDGSPKLSDLKDTAYYLGALLTLDITAKGIKLIDTRRSENNRRSLSWGLDQFQEALGYYKGLIKSLARSKRGRVIFCHESVRATLPEGVDIEQLSLQTRTEEPTSLEGQVTEAEISEEARER